MSATAQKGNLRAIPQELWDRIITYAAADGRYASKTWFALRRVSQRFKTAAEKAFFEAYLKKVEIRYNFGHVDHDHWGTTPMDLTLAFDRSASRGDDGDRVIFRDEENAIDKIEEEKRDETEKMMAAQWKQQTHFYKGDGRTHSRHDLPPHIIVLRRSPRWQWVNDTDLPGMEIDYEACEVSFQWPGMLSALFSEEDRVNRLRRAAFRRFEQPKLEEMRTLFQQDTSNLVDIFDAVAQMMSNSKNMCYRMARRERIRTWYKKNGNGFELSEDYFQEDFDEAERLRELKDVRATLSYEDWDDDEDDDAAAAHERLAFTGNAENEKYDDDERIEFEDNDFELDIDDLENERRMIEEDEEQWRQEQADDEIERYLRLDDPR